MTFEDFILSNTYLLKGIMPEKIKETSIYPNETTSFSRKKLRQKRQELKLLLNANI